MSNANAKVEEHELPERVEELNSLRHLNPESHVLDIAKARHRCIIGRILVSC